MRKNCSICNQCENFYLFILQTSSFLFYLPFLSFQMPPKFIFLTPFFFLLFLALQLFLTLFFGQLCEKEFQLTQLTDANAFEFALSGRLHWPVSTGQLCCFRSGCTFTAPSRRNRQTWRNCFHFFCFVLFFWQKDIVDNKRAWSEETQQKPLCLLHVCQDLYGSGCNFDKGWRDAVWASIFPTWFSKPFMSVGDPSSSRKAPTYMYSHQLAVIETFPNIIQSWHCDRPYPRILRPGYSYIHESGLP